MAAPNAIGGLVAYSDSENSDDEEIPHGSEIVKHLSAQLAEHGMMVRPNVPSNGQLVHVAAQLQAFTDSLAKSVSDSVVECRAASALKLTRLAGALQLAYELWQDGTFSTIKFYEAFLREVVRCGLSAEVIADDDAIESLHQTLSPMLADDAAEAPTSLPTGWIEAVDPTSGDSYYCYMPSKATVWERPTYTDADEACYEGVMPLWDIHVRRCNGEDIEMPKFPRWRKSRAGTTVHTPAGQADTTSPSSATTTAPTTTDSSTSAAPSVSVQQASVAVANTSGSSAASMPAEVVASGAADSDALSSTLIVNVPQPPAARFRQLDGESLCIFLHRCAAVAGGPPGSDSEFTLSDVFYRDLSESMCTCRVREKGQYHSGLRVHWLRSDCMIGEAAGPFRIAPHVPDVMAAAAGGLVLVETASPEVAAWCFACLTFSQAEPPTCLDWVPGYVRTNRSTVATSTDRFHLVDVFVRIARLPEANQYVESGEYPAHRIPALPISGSEYAALQRHLQPDSGLEVDSTPAHAGHSATVTTSPGDAVASSGSSYREATATSAKPTKRKIAYMEGGQGYGGEASTSRKSIGWEAWKKKKKSSHR